MNKIQNRAVRYSIRILGSGTIEKGETEETFMGNTLNISLSGALIETGYTLPVGALFQYRFNVPGEKKSLNITTEVVRKASLDPGPAGKNAGGLTEEPNRGSLHLYGVHFLDMSEEDRGAIINYIYQ